MYVRLVPLIVCLPLLVAPPAANAVAFPELVNPRILICYNTDIVCAQDVVYASDGTQMVDIAPLSPPSPTLGTRLEAYGMHCQRGTILPPGARFTGCQWVPEAAQHSPRITSECMLKDTSSWEVTPTSTCSTPSRWGYHVGAGPGGECVIFAQGGQTNPVNLLTPRGLIDANTAANAGSTFCQKMLPPDVTCNVDLPPVIDHGTITPTMASSVWIEGTVSCGDNPHIAFLGGALLSLGPGVTTALTHTTGSSGNLRITSDLTAKNATPGTHQTSVVVSVSPY
ncbi:Uncharacterised protein [Serratia proteamaculans]|nr:Uncharacterised protein [Serratia proteamaculans]